MSESSDNQSVYQGTLTLPGEREPREMFLAFDQDEQSVMVRFDPAIEGSDEWPGSKVRISRRLRYREVWFSTTGIPKGNVELGWKCNAGLEDGTMAGVVAARPNEEKVSGERGFILSKVT